MKRRKNIKRVLASLLTLQMILFTGFVAYPQQAYAEETVNNQGNEQYLSEDNYEGPKEQNDSGQEEKEIQKTDEKLEDSLEIQQQEEKSSITESDDMENQQTAESAFEESESQDPTLTYRVHVSNVGWQSEVENGDVAGTTGKSLAVEALQLNLGVPKGKQGSVEYAAYVSELGWQNKVENGEIAGTVGRAKSVEAFKMNLTGEIADEYDIYYRAHSSGFGWLGWAKNGQDAGTSGYGYQVEAMQIKLVPKNTAAPGSTANAFKKAPPRIVNDMQIRANMYSSSTPYLILVNRSTHRVGIFRGWQGNWQSIQYWSCSDGAPSTPTVEGVFTVGIRGYYFDSGAARCYWYTQFKGNYLFHSVLYNKNGTLRDGRLGMALSHGCVRLDINNAKWIYDNIPSGTTVVVYH